MNYNRLYLISLLSVLISSPFFFSSCDEGEQEKISCRILAVDKIGYTEEYSYNADNKVQTIIRRYPDDDFVMTGTLDYNDKGQLAKYTVTDNDSPVGTAIMEFIYEGKNKPQKMHFWRDNKPLSAVEGTYNFTHDERDRLVTIESVYANGTTLRRFEYDRNDNVSKVFLKYNEDTESLSTENLEFDSNSTLYSQATELEIIELYGELGIPNKNNVLRTKVYREPNEPLVVTFSPTYDEHGLVQTNISLNDGATGITQFSGVTRDCQ